MFTGIIESTGAVSSVKEERSNRIFWIESTLSEQLKIDQSVSHNGVCLTIEAIQHHSHRVTAIRETLDKTNLQHWKAGDIVNLERSMLLNSRIDGHLVQGHVDSTALCIAQQDRNGSIEYTFEFERENAALIIEKGSICVNGVSLTAFQVGDDRFTVAIIPYTLEHTNFKYLQLRGTVNLEFDMLGKYVSRILHIQGMK